MPIYNESLKRYIEIVFNKKFDIITEDEISRMEVVTIESDSEKDTSIDWKELELFENMRSLTISKKFINNIDFQKLSEIKNINDVSFYNCYFNITDFDIILSSLSEINIFGCYVNDYGFIKNQLNLKELRIVNPKVIKTIDFSIFTRLTNLEVLNVEGFVINKFDKIDKFINLKELSLLNSFFDTRHLPEINQLVQLQKLYISEKMVENIIKFTDEIEVFYDKCDLVFDKEEKNLK